MAPPTPFEDLVSVMARLRGPDGCPWDREQTLESLRGYLLEESYEALEAIDGGDPRMVREELGDLLLEVVFLAQICAERGLFNIHDVAAGIRDKLVRRHPHVFGGRPASGAREAIQRWEEIKNAERAAAGTPDASVLDGVPKNLPALLRAHRLSTKASVVGFDWKAAEQLHEKVDEELSELRTATAAGDREAMQEELGDLLFALANVGRFASIDPEQALQAANRKFLDRFHYVELALRRRGVPLEEAGLDLMETLWQEAKQVDPSPEKATDSHE